MKSGYLLLPLILTGCGFSIRPHHFPCELYLDASLSSREQSSIIDATKAWGKATDGIVKVDVFIGQPPDTLLEKHIFTGYDSFDPRVELVDDDGSLVGFTEVRNNYHNWNMFLVSDRLSQNFLPDYATRWVALHELGHHFGLKHRDQEEDSIMVPRFKSYFRQKLCVSSLDLRNFCEIYNCAGRKMEPTCLLPPRGRLS